MHVLTIVKGNPAGDRKWLRDQGRGERGHPGPHRQSRQGGDDSPCNHGAVADRRPKTLRDMALSLGLLAVVALLLYGMYGQVSCSPGGATEGQAPTADVTGGLQRAAPLVGFPVVLPGPLPDGWNASSFSFTEQPGRATQPPTVRAGWLTPRAGSSLSSSRTGPLGTCWSPNWARPGRRPGRSRSA